MYPPDGAYTIKRTMVLDGVTYENGDALPKDAGVRENPKRMEQLIRLRRLVPGEGKVTAKAAVASTNTSRATGSAPAAKPKAAKKRS